MPPPWLQPRHGSRQHDGVPQLQQPHMDAPKCRSGCALHPRMPSTGTSAILPRSVCNGTTAGVGYPSAGDLPPAVPLQAPAPSMPRSQRLNPTSYRSPSRRSCVRFTEKVHRTSPLRIEPHHICRKGSVLTCWRNGGRLAANLSGASCGSCVSATVDLRCCNQAAWKRYLKFRRRTCMSGLTRIAGSSGCKGFASCGPPIGPGSSGLCPTCVAGCSRSVGGVSRYGC